MSDHIASGSWREMYACHNCGWMSEWQHELYPCKKCGARDYSSYTTRYVTYKQPSFIRAILGRFGYKRAPRPTWEFKNKNNKRPPEKVLEAQSSRSRFELLKLQTELLEILPDQYDVAIEQPGRIVVTRGRKYEP